MDQQKNLSRIVSSPQTGPHEGLIDLLIRPGQQDQLVARVNDLSRVLRTLVSHNDFAGCRVQSRYGLTDSQGHIDAIIDGGSGAWPTPR